MKPCGHTLSEAWDTSRTTEGQYFFLYRLSRLLISESNLEFRNFKRFNNSFSISIEIVGITVILLCMMLPNMLAYLVFLNIVICKVSKHFGTCCSRKHALTKYVSNITGILILLANYHHHLSSTP